MTGRRKDILTNRETDRQAGRNTDRHIVDIHIFIHALRNTWHTERQTDREIERLTASQPERLTD